MKKILLLVTERSIELNEQLNDLKRVFGEDSEILISLMSNYASCEDIIAVGNDHQFDVLAGDFSMEVLTKLINPEKNEKPVVRTKWQKIYDGFNYLGLEEVKMVFEEL